MNIETIKALMKAEGIGPSELSRRMGMQRSAGTAVLKGKNGTKEVTYETRLEKAFGVPAGTLRGGVDIPIALDDVATPVEALKLIAIAKIIGWDVPKVKRSGWRFLFETLANVEYDYAAWLSANEGGHSAVKKVKK